MKNVEENTSMVFPHQGGLVTVPLGFQPAGIATQGNFFVMADYFGPAFVTGEVLTEGEETRLGNLKRVAGVLPRGNIRMFPDILPEMGLNRMQTVIIYSPTRLGLVRNSDCIIFDVELRDDGRWEHVPYSGPRSRTKEVITSAVRTPDGLVTIEINQSAGVCTLRDYCGAKLKEYPVPQHRYGVAIRPHDGAIITLDDSRASGQHGIYANDAVLVPDIDGNSIALVDGGKGGAFITRYAYERSGPLGQPGELVYLPPRYVQ